MKLSLRKSAELIQQQSGHPLNRKSLLHLIKKNRWPFKVYYPSESCTYNKEWLLNLEDVLEFSKNFKGMREGVKFGRPRKIKNAPGERSY